MVFFALLGGSRKAEDLREMGASADDFRERPERDEPVAVVDAAPEAASEELGEVAEEAVEEAEEAVAPPPVKKRTEDVDKLAAKMEDLSEEEKKFIMATRKRLQKMVPDMVKAMRKFTPLRDPSRWTDGEKETYLFDFEVDPGDYRVIMYPSADDATRLGEEPILKLDWPILEQGVHQMPPDEDDHDYVAYRALQDKVFADWFAFCWHQAGGRISYFPAYLTFTDSDQAFNLKRKNWERK